MRVDHAHRNEVAVVGDAVHSDAAVVVRDILDEPVDRVVRVGGFVDAFRIGGRIVDGMKHHEFALDRKSTRLNSSHVRISYAVFCLKKKNKHTIELLTKKKKRKMTNYKKML